VVKVGDPPDRISPVAFRPDYATLAERAEQEAELAATPGIADGWLNLAVTYRQLAQGEDPRGIGKTRKDHSGHPAYRD
jgi:hypothetical protein